MLLLVHVPVADEQSLALHHHLNLSKIVADQSRTRTYNIENTVSQTDARTDFYRTRNDMDVGIDVVLLHKLAQDVRVRSSNLLAVEPLQSRIINLLRNGEAQAALAETQTVNNLRILSTLNKLVLAHDSDICHTRGYALRNIIITKVENLERKVA